MTSRLSYGTRREGPWSWITWPQNIVHSRMVLRCISDAKDIPGCREYPGGIMISRTASNVEAVTNLAKVCGVDLKWQEPSAIPFLGNLYKTLYTHQRIAIEKFISNGARGLLADEPGLGKTRVAISIAQTVRSHYDGGRPVVILAKKYLRATWIRELILCGEDPNSISVLETRDLDDKSFRHDASWFFVNPEIVRAWWPRLIRTKHCMTLIDEAHHYKDGRSQRSKGALMVSTSPHMLCMTGTPMPDKPQDLWSLMSMITGRDSWGNAVGFITRYAGAYHNGHGTVPQFPTNVEELQARLEPWYLRRTVQEIRGQGFWLPDMQRTVIESSWDDVSLGVNTKRKHDATIKKHYGQIAKALLEGKVSNEALKIIGDLRMQTSLAKVDATVDYVRELRNSGESVVVFTWSKEAAKRIADKLIPKSSFDETPDVYLCTGDYSQKVRDQLVERFTKDGGIMVATYGTLAEGVTLTRARFVVLHDLDWTPATIEQAEKRVHRIGQQYACIAAWIIMRDSIDELFAKRLQWKLHANAELINNTNHMLQQMVVQVTRPRSFEEDFEEYMRRWREAS